MLFLPISVFIDNLFLILLTISTFLVKKRVYPLKSIVFSSLIIFFVYVVCLGLVSLEFETNEYLKLLPLLIIPYSFSYLKKDVLINGLYFFLVAVILKQLMAVYGIIEYYYFTPGVKVPLASYAGVNEILYFERPYLGYFSALNVIIAYYFFKNYKVWLFALICFFSTLIVVLISARMGLLIIMVTLLCILISKISKRFRLVLLLFSIIVFTLFIQTNNPLKNRFQQIKYDSRLIVWNGALEIAKEHSNYIFGIKNQNTIKKSLLNFYENKAEFEYPPDKIRFVTKGYNTHNQFLNEFLRGGIIALLLLISPFVYALYNSFKSHNLAFALLVLSVLMLLLVENLLARQIGVYITAIILSLSRKIDYEKN